MLIFLFYDWFVIRKCVALFLSNELQVPFPFQEKDLEWFPRMRAMSLSKGETEGEMNEVRLLNTKLDRTQKLVDSLVDQLSELKEEVSYVNYKKAPTDNWSKRFNDL